MKLFSNSTKSINTSVILILISITQVNFFINCADNSNNQNDSISQIGSDETPQDKQELDKLSDLMAIVEQESLNTILEAAQDQIRTVDATLEDLATVISNDVVRKIKDKKTHIVTLTAIRDIVNESRKYTTSAVINENSAWVSILFTRFIVSHLLNALDNGFYELDDLDLSIYMDALKKAPSLTVEDLALELKKNEILLKELDSKANIVGLSWYNHLYRSTKNATLVPFKRYKLGPISLIGGLGTATLLTIWWRLGGKVLPDMPERLREWEIPFTDGKKLFGYVPKISNTGDIIGYEDDTAKGVYYERDSTGNIVLNNQEDQVGILGHLETKLYQFATGNSPITRKLAAVSGWAIKESSPHLLKWTSEKIQKLDNFLMGGAYRNKEVGDLQTKSKVNFDNVIGCEQAKEHGKILCSYMQNPERFDRRNNTPTKGYLLIGGTRTGKSFFVEALLGELQRSLGTNNGGFKLWRITYKTLKELGIERLLQIAKYYYAPCIIFIDEIDLLGLQRTEHDRELLSGFLQSMSGMLTKADDAKNAIILIGATNREENLDFALRQPGRFGEILPFEKPTYAERKQFIERELNKSAINLENFDVEKLAVESEGYVFEAINLVIKKAMMKAQIDNHPITQKLLEKTFDESIRGILEDTKDIPESQKDILATHQAGHALANILLSPSKTLSKVTIAKMRSEIIEESLQQRLSQTEENKRKQVEYGHMFTHHAKDALEFETRDERIKECKIMLAGHIAEQLLMGSTSYNYHAEDRNKALKITHSIAFGSLSEDQLPKNVKDKLRNEAYNLLIECEQEIQALLSENKDKLQKLADALKESVTLDIREINKLFADKQEQA